ncbi:MAG TPA: glucose 1-dehydrogenase [Planktothrix sp.]
MTTLQSVKEKTSSKRLLGKVALVTGGSRGIGAGIALRLAEEGATVAINYSNNKVAADQVVKDINALGSKATAFQANVSSEKDTQKLVDEVVKTYGKIDILVNNAGVFELAPLEQVTLEHYDHVFNVNIKGVIAATTAAVKKMNDGGRIINITSVAATATVAGMSVYSASKAALNALTRNWAQDLGSRKITVNGVGPGPVDTDMLRSGLDDEMSQAMVAKTALGRIGQADDIAAVVAFLASEDGRWVNGQNINADGGLNF